MPVEKGTKSYVLEKPGKPIQTISGLGVGLDENDLRELSARFVASDLSGSRELTSGALSFSAQRVRTDSQIKQIVEDAVGTGRFRISAHNPNRHGEGNVVLIPRGIPDETVAAAIMSVDKTSLAPAIHFFQSMDGQVERINFFPNASKNGTKLNGAYVTMRPREKKWWQSIPAINKFPMGRGILLGVLSGMTADQFIDQSDEIMLQASAIGTAFPRGSIKYISFLHGGSNGQMYVCIAAGPSPVQSTHTLDDLRTALRQSDAASIVGFAHDSGREFRSELFKMIIRMSGTEGEMLTNQPYIALNLNNATLFSGGLDATNDTPDANGLGMFTVGEDRLLLYRPSGNEVSPLGIKAEPKFQPMLPKGVHPNIPGATYIQAPSTDRVTQIIKPSDTLTTLAIPFHSGWGSTHKE